MKTSFGNKGKMKTVFQKETVKALSPERTDPAADVAFVVGGLKAALNSPRLVRHNVISDVSAVLNCKPEDLDFLFADGQDTQNDTQIYDFPDAERRRRVIHNNFLDAAE